MQVAKLLPLLVMGGITAHSGGAIKERLAGALGAKDQIIAKQRLTAILDAAALHVASGEELELDSPEKLRTFTRRAVRIKGSDRADPSLDPWGKRIKAKLGARGLTLISAGPDRKFGTSDDVVVRRDIFNL